MYSMCELDTGCKCDSLPLCAYMYILHACSAIGLVALFTTKPFNVQKRISVFGWGLLAT